jgi:cysteine sulfinate desulfinase/cysteine desulfurase-like protein
MVINTMNHLASISRGTVVTIPVLFAGNTSAPTSTNGDSLAKVLNDTLVQCKVDGLTVRVVVMSHITSCPAVIMPVEQVANICKEFGVPFLVDGAHALGHIPIDLTKVNFFCRFILSILLYCIFFANLVT